MTTPCDVLVVGAGLAGLAAARRLVDAGQDAVVLEARDRVGGRTALEPVGAGAVDVGGQWIGPGQERAAALARELGLTVVQAWTRGAKLLMLNGELRSYTGEIPKLSPLSLLALHFGMRRVERLVAQLDLERPAALPGAAALDARSVASWAEETFRSRDARALLDPVLRVVFGVDPGERVIANEGGNQQDLIVGGAAQLGLGLARMLGDRVATGAAVTDLAQDGDGVTVTSAAGIWRARRVIVTAPPPIAGRIRYTPALPTARDQLCQRATMGTLCKMFALYDRPFWRDAGLSGEAVLAGRWDGPPPFDICFDATVGEGGQPALLAFSGGSASIRWGERAAAERREAVLSALERCFGPEARKPTGWVEKRWADDPWARGGPVAILPPGALTSCGDALRTPVGRLHWAGTETATLYQGFMEGALLSGERAAAEVLTAS